MMFLGIDNGQPQHCNTVTHVAGVGRAAYLRVGLRGSLPPAGCAVTLQSDNGDGAISLALQVSEGKGKENRVVILADEVQAASPKGVRAQGALIVHQRRSVDDGLHNFLNRVAEPRTYVIKKGLAEAEISAALPPGTCVLVREGESETVRAGRAVAAARGSRTVVGQARALNKNRAWNVLVFNPAETTLPYALKLNEGDWEQKVIEAAPPGDCVVRASLRSDDVWSVLKAVVEAENASVSIGRAGGQPLDIPVLPMTVLWGGTALFAAEIETTFDLTASGSSNNTAIRIRLVADPVCSPIAPDLSDAVVLARIANGSSSDPDLVMIEPCDQGAGDALDRLPAWKLGGGEPIEALMVAPGNTRGDQAAFYSRWRAGDHVLLRLDQGRLPLILGAPRRRLKAHEDVEADVVLQGQKLLQIAQSDGENKRTAITLDGSGHAHVLAPDELKLNDGVTLVPDKMTIHHETTIGKKATMEGEVSIKGKTTIGGDLEVGQAGG
jgi:hypothetical protein